MEHLVFNIKRFAVHDGPGIRTTVFLKGCPLRCPWCQNPESLTNRLRLVYNFQSCIACHQCIEVCPENVISAAFEPEKAKIHIDRNGCTLCGECVNICPSGALTFDSFMMTPEMILNEVLKDKVFYPRNNGGVTFSGGEPFFNPEFLMSCVGLCKNEKLHVAIDTTLNAQWQDISKFLGLIDLYLVDLKYFNEKVHDEIAGGSGLLIKENIIRLNKQRENILLRVPLIPEYTATKDNLREIGRFYRMLKSGNENIEIELLNYNPYARSKYEKHGFDTAGLPDKWKYSDEQMREFEGEVISNQ